MCLLYLGGEGQGGGRRGAGERAWSGSAAARPPTGLLLWGSSTLSDTLSGHLGQSRGSLMLCGPPHPKRQLLSPAHFAAAASASPTPLPPMAAANAFLPA